MFSIRTIWGSISIVLTDAIICYSIFWLTISNWSNPSHLVAGGNLPNQGLSATCTFAIVLSLALTRLYSFMEYVYPIDLIRQMITAYILSFASLATLGFVFNVLRPINHRLFLPLFAGFTLIFFFRYYLFYRLPKNRERILLLGVTNQSLEIIKEARRKKYRGYEIIGIITSTEKRIGTEIQGVPVLGLIEHFESMVATHRIDKIVVALRERRGKLPVRELLACKVRNLRVQESASFLERTKRKLIIDEYLKPSWFIFEEGFFHTTLHGSIKRWQGILVSFTLLVVLSPILALVALLIKLESSGPVFFQQERTGLNGKVFRLLKFRSMHQNAESLCGPVFASKCDPRVTKMGSIIRKLRLDEVPQFINIFKGDMDLVGPRPERPFFVSQLEQAIPYYNMRHTVRPGLTGWAQVNYPYGDSIEDGKEKLQYDLYYVKNSSWHLDLLIIFMTFKEVLLGGGR